MPMKRFLDSLVATYKTPDFIAGDPLSFPHAYREDNRTCELVAFLAALFSYGRRDLILQTVQNILERMDGDPLAFVEGFGPRKARAFDGFIYRFNRPEDLVFLCRRLQAIYGDYGSLEAFWQDHGLAAGNVPTREGLASFVARFLANEADCPQRYGMKFLFATPDRGGACKRFNMFLRWVVRDDGVDLGLWRHALRPADLVMPLDTHVAKVGRDLGLISRNANDWQSAEEMTATFRRFCPQDPVRYDFALFGLGVSGETQSPRRLMSRFRKQGTLAESTFNLESLC